MNCIALSSASCRTSHPFARLRSHPRALTLLVSCQYSPYCAVVCTTPSSGPLQASTESRWLRAASYHRRKNQSWQDKKDDFLACSGPDFEKQHNGSPLQTTASELRFHIIVKDLTSTRLKAALQSSRTRELETGEGDRSIPLLQHAASIRLHRAWYYFQRICQMYPLNTRPWQSGPRSQGDHLVVGFVRGLPSWELEELRCIYQFLILSLSFLDEPAHSAFVRVQSSV